MHARYVRVTLVTPLDRLPALQSREFRELLAGSLVSNIGTQIQAWAIGWHIYELTGSSLAVGLLGLVRVVPLLIFSLIGGVVADHADRRKVMLWSQCGMLGVAILLATTTALGVVNVGVIYFAAALYSITRSFDAPSRQSMVVNLVPPEHYPNAASLNGIVWRISDVLGPVFTGLIIANHGIPGFGGLGTCYLLNAITFIAVLISIYRLTPRPPSPEVVTSSPKSVKDLLRVIADGIRFVHGTPVVRQSMFIDFWATFFSAADALLPAFAKDIFQMGSEGYGILAGSISVGALLAAIYISLRPIYENQGKIVVRMVFIYGICTLGFALSPYPILAMIFLAGTGAADMISTVMRQTIRQLATPNEMRGRMTAYSSLYFMSGPQLGDAESGVLARLTGERAAVAIGGTACLGVSLLWSRARELLNYRQQQ